METKASILVLHGSRQTGELLVGRMAKLRKKLEKMGVSLVAPDGPFPHPDDAALRQWWNREGNHYRGLEETLLKIETVWKEHQCCGVMGFSQGARLAHLVCLARDRFPGLNFAIFVAGYDGPLPPELSLSESPTRVSVPSLHVWGETDQLITPAMSQAVADHYESASIHRHEGGHHVPMKAEHVRLYTEFIEAHLSPPADQEESLEQQPDQETLQTQLDEVDALSAIFPDEFDISEGSSIFPIRYRVRLPKSDEGVWPTHEVALEVSYPYNYPEGAPPLIKLFHKNNVMQFSSIQRDALNRKIAETIKAEEGMPCVLSCVYAAREFFESGEMATFTTVEASNTKVESDIEHITSLETEEVVASSSMIRKSSPERIAACNLEGLQIAESILKSTTDHSEVSLKGGSLDLTLGLVGKPSAGKSTFFNTATAFARQRNDKETLLGGATMASHPFTTIDPNVGFCLVPVPHGMCPEDDYAGTIKVACTHGRDNKGRRLVPALLKDVAGLVPGAYQGRGKGNQFLADLTDASILINVLDASGMADTEGNLVGDDMERASNPLNDLSWIRNELIEWIYTNLSHKWDTIKRRGRSKLQSMFGGYGQPQGVTEIILSRVEKFMEVQEKRPNPLDNLDSWDQGDIHRLVSAFLGVRFPSVLALNKSDLPSSKEHIDNITGALPIHGAHVGIPLSAHQEMNFLKYHILRRLGEKVEMKETMRSPVGVWETLSQTLVLRKPILIFPVIDFTSYTPLPGLNKRAIEDPSLPSLGMTACLEEADGSLPTHWNPKQEIYEPVGARSSHTLALRDVILLKEGSTVETAFLTLKNLGALSGEFVRAEAACQIGEAPKPIPKSTILSRSTRILKIMTTKRTAWQKS